MVHALPCVGDGGLVRTACFVVKDLGGNGVTVCFKAHHDGVVRWDTVSVVLHLEWLDKDYVGTYVIRQHDMLVPTLCMDGEASKVVRIQCN